LPACSTYPFLPCSFNESRDAILAGGFQILQQVLSILGYIAFIQVFDALAGILGAIAAQCCRIALFFGAGFYTAHGTVIGLVAINLATDTFVPGSLEGHAKVADDSAGGQAGVVHGCSCTVGSTVVQ
jgi:hypothetical protein